MEFTSVRVHLSTNPLKSQSPPQLHLLARPSSQGPEPLQRRRKCFCQRTSCQELFSSLSRAALKPSVLEEMLTTPRWLAECPSTPPPSFPREPHSYTPSPHLHPAGTILLSACGCCVLQAQLEWASLQAVTSLITPKQSTQNIHLVASTCKTAS